MDTKLITIFCVLICQFTIVICDEKKVEDSFLCAVKTNGTESEPKETRFRCGYSCYWHTPTYLNAIPSMSKLNQMKSDNLKTCSGSMCNLDACMQEMLPIYAGVPCSVVGAIIVSILFTKIYKMGLAETRRVIGEKFDRARTFFGGCLMACANRVSPDVVQPGTYKIEIMAQQEESKLSERMINFFLYSSNFLLLVS